MPLETNYRIGNVQTPESMTSIMNRGLGGFLDKRITQLTAEEDKKYQQEKDVQQQANWEKSFSLQQAQADRVQKEFDRKVLGQNMMSHIDAATADVMNRGALTKAGQDKILATAAQMEKAGRPSEEIAAVIGNMYETNQGNIRQVPMSTKAKIGAVEGINLGSGELQYDPSLALGQKDKLLSSLRSDYQNELNRDQQMSLTKMKIAADAAEGAKNRAVKGEKFSPYVVTVGFDSKGKPTSDPSKIAYKSQVNITSPQMGDYAVRKYGKDNLMLGAVTDFIPDKSGSGSNSGSAVVPLRTGTGSWDDRRIANLATVLQTSGLSNKDAIGLANMSVEDKWYGTGVNFNKILEPAYVKLKAKNPSITKDEVANLLNTAFD